MISMLKSFFPSKLNECLLFGTRHIFYSFEGTSHMLSLCSASGLRTLADLLCCVQQHTVFQGVLPTALMLWVKADNLLQLIYYSINIRGCSILQHKAVS